jgi:hypothetical protein
MRFEPPSIPLRCGHLPVDERVITVFVNPQSPHDAARDDVIGSSVDAPLAYG